MENNTQKKNGLPVFNETSVGRPWAASAGNQINAAEILGQRRAYLSRLLKALEPCQSF